MRIVTLLPSATETVCAIGLADQLVGITHECDYPSDVLGLPRVTRALLPERATSGEIDEAVRELSHAESALYSLDRELLQSLKPDLIVTQTLCDVCAVAPREVNTAVKGLGGEGLGGNPDVLYLEPTTLQDVLSDVRRVAEAAGALSLGDVTARSLQKRIDRVAARSESIRHRPSVMLLEWMDPPYSAGHWNPELVQLAGGSEVIGRPGQRSVSITWDAIASADPEVIVIACCGFDVQRTLDEVSLLSQQPQWGSLGCVRRDRVHVVDGSAYFSRPGPRLVDSLEILAHALHSDVHPLPAGLPKAATLGATSR